VPDLLADQLADDETIRQRAAGDRTDVAVTDRRVVSVDGTNRPDDATSRCILLVGPHVTGVEIDRESGNDQWQTLAGIALLASVIAFGGAVVGSDIGGVLGLIGGLSAVLFALGAALEYGRDRGTVSVVVEFSGQDDEEITLPSDGGTVVAEEIATVVGETRAGSVA
jgi:hypothetical protein